MMKGCFRVQCAAVTICNPVTTGTSSMSGRTMLLLSSAVASLVGCSSSGYDKDLAARIDAYRSAAEFSALNTEPTPLAGGRVLVRAPRLFTAQFDDPEKEDRATPPFLRDYPGFQRAFEAQLDVPNAKLPAVLTVGIVPSAERSRDDIEADVLRQVRGEESFRGASWQKGRELPDVAGVTRKWDVLTLKGGQLFDRIIAENTESKRSDGTSQIWVSADPGQEFCTVLAWRVPEEVATAVKLDDLAPLVARTNQIVPAQAPVAAQEPAKVPQ
jgi:hypothetical protein